MKIKKCIIPLLSISLMTSCNYARKIKASFNQILPGQGRTLASTSSRVHIATIGVEKLEHTAHEGEKFMVKAVIPLLKNQIKMLEAGELSKSMFVRLPNGEEHPVQMEVVSLFPSDGTDRYVEKMQLIFEGINYAPGSDLSFEILKSDEVYIPQRNPQYTQETVDFMGYDKNLFVVIEDMYGQRYAASGTRKFNDNGQRNFEILKEGQYERELTTHNIMTALVGQRNVKNNSLGLKTFIRYYTKNIIEVDLIIHNAHDGSKEGYNDVSHAQWFKNIKVHIPRGWRLKPVYKTPTFPTNPITINSTHPLTNAPSREITLVEAMDKNKMQFLRGGRQIMLRTILYRSASPSTPSHIVKGREKREYLGFPKPGFNQAGSILHAFAGRFRENYLPNTSIANIAQNIDINTIRQNKKNEFEDLENAVLTGSANQANFMFDKACGFFHGSSDSWQGGAAGGVYIDLYRNTDGLVAGSRESFRNLELHTQLISNRQYFSTIDYYGNPSRRENFLDVQNGITINPTAEGAERGCMLSLTNYKDKNDSFGYCDAFREQVPSGTNQNFLTNDYLHAKSHNLVPNCFERENVYRYQNVDDNHLARSNRSLFPVAAIMNDSVTKFFLEQFAERMRMRNSEYPTRVKWNGELEYHEMASLRQRAINQPNSGKERSVRSIGHTLEKASMSYTLIKDIEKRARLKEFANWVGSDVLFALQPNLPINSEFSGGPFQLSDVKLNGVAPMAGQGYENGLYANGVYGMLRSFHDEDSTNPDKLKLESALKSLVQYYVWGAPRDVVTKKFWDQVTTFYNGQFLITPYSPVVNEVLQDGLFWNTEHRNKQYQEFNTSPYFFIAFKLSKDLRYLCEAVKTYGGGDIDALRNNWTQQGASFYTDNGSLASLFHQVNWQIPGGCP